MDQVLFDKLSYTQTLRNGGIAEEQAQLHANALDTALREAVATKVDILHLDAKIDSDIARLDVKIDNLRKDMEALRTELKGDINILAAKFDMLQKITLAGVAGIVLLIIKAFI